MDALVFWCALALVAYGLLGYPLLMIVLSLFIDRRVSRDETARSVEILIPVHNGAAMIEQKIRNCLELDYPPEALKIRVVSDGSTDDTVSIVGRYEHRGVECTTIQGRVGKVAAQNRALSPISSEIIVLTDLDVRVQRDAL